jgi:hypothetical protein
MPAPRGIRRCRLDRSGRQAARGSARCRSPTTIRTGRLVYAGRAGTGINTAELERLWRRLQPLATSEMPLEVPPPRASRFGSPLVLSRVHWVRPELVAEVKYLTWTDDNLLRQVVYEGLREDKPAAEVRRPVRHRPRCAGRCRTDYRARLAELSRRSDFGGGLRLGAIIAKTRVAGMMLVVRKGTTPHTGAEHLRSYAFA